MTPFRDSRFEILTVHRLAEFHIQETSTQSLNTHYIMYSPIGDRARRHQKKLRRTIHNDNSRTAQLRIDRVTDISFLRSVLTLKVT